MEGEQLPKATMNSFVRQQTDTHFTPDFIIKLLGLSKQFVVRLTDRANDICEQLNKKTISAEHLEAALNDLGIAHHTARLKELGSTIKEINQLKREASQRIEESIERELREQRELRMLQEPEKKAVTVRETFGDIAPGEKAEDDFDYDNLIDVEEQEAGQ